MNKLLNALMFLALALLLAVPAWSAPLLAGAGKAEFHLSDDMPLSGYVDRINKPNTGIHDPVYARALVLESDGVKAAVISADLLIMTRELRADILERARDLDLDFLSISATHTHYSVGSYVDNTVAELAVMGKYRPDAYAMVADTLERALREAAAEVAPVKMGAAAVESPGVSINRRHEDGPTDPMVRVLGFWSDDGSLKAAIVNHAIHPTTVSTTDTKISGDCAGATERKIEEAHPGAVALFMNAGLGDQAPDVPFFGGDWDDVEEIGEKLAKSADKALLSMTPTADVEMTTYERSFDMPEPYLRRSHECWWGLNQLFKVLGKNMMRSEGHLMGLGLNDALLLFSPAEVAYEVQANIEGEFPGKQVMVVVHSNDLYGYVVTPEDYDTGGYETCMNFYGRGFAPLLESEFEAMVKGD